MHVCACARMRQPALGLLPNPSIACSCCSWRAHCHACVPHHLAPLLQRPLHPACGAHSCAAPPRALAPTFNAPRVWHPLVCCAALRPCSQFHCTPHVAPTCVLHSPCLISDASPNPCSQQAPLGHTPSLLLCAHASQPQ